MIGRLAIGNWGCALVGLLFFCLGPPHRIGGRLVDHRVVCDKNMSSLYPHFMCPRRARHVLSMCPRVPANVPTMRRLVPACALHVPTMRRHVPTCALRVPTNMPTMCPPCARHVPTMCPPCVLSTLLVEERVSHWR